MVEMVPTKQKSFKISEELAIDFEIQAKLNRVREIDLITRYIEEGIERDRNKQNNQTTLD